SKVSCLWQLLANEFFCDISFSLSPVHCMPQAEVHPHSYWSTGIYLRTSKRPSGMILSLAIYSSTSLWCQRCIVVGNGHSIHGQRFGNLIDSHHVIIRLNDAPVREYKKDVGERTSIRLFFPESALPNPLENNDNDTLMVFVPFKPSDFLWLREVLLKTRNKVGFWYQPPQQWNGNISQLRVLNPYVTYEATYKLLQLNLSDFHGRYATMGIIALNLALHICQEVNIAGFGYPGNHDNTAPIHYYNTGRSRKEEGNWLLKMIERGVIADLASPAFQAQNR
uniref:ST3 beta-galactoside alpha-2,3-sialyltransferase 4 n=1 Tax=Anas zonorhyncha TaxID=75864 RepID=A0A8B9U1U3_9AVES